MTQPRPTQSKVTVLIAQGEKTLWQEHIIDIEKGEITFNESWLQVFTGSTDLDHEGEPLQSVYLYPSRVVLRVSNEPMWRSS